MSYGARYRRSEQAVWRATATHVVVLPHRGEELVRLSGSGVAMWQTLERPRSLDEIASLLAEAFDVQKSTVIHDIAPVLDDLLARGVLLIEDDVEVERTA